MNERDGRNGSERTVSKGNPGGVTAEALACDNPLCDGTLVGGEQVGREEINQV